MTAQNFFLRTITCTTHSGDCPKKKKMFLFQPIVNFDYKECFLTESTTEWYIKYYVKNPSTDKLKRVRINVSSKVDFHQSGTEKGTRERVRSKVTKFGYHYKFLSSF